jgi:predicted ribosome-associated RNA-binding protein Tma20
MSQKDELTSEQKKELTKIAAEIEAEAIQMKIDYDINPSEESGSVVYIHQESSLLENEDEKLDDVALVSSTKLLAKELKKQKKKKGDKK